MTRPVGPSTHLDGGGERLDIPAIAQAIGLAIVAVIPAFLTGALAVGIRAELGFGPSVLGLVVAWFFVTSAVCAAVLGQVVERLGVPRSLTIGASASGCTLAGIALTPTTGWLLAAMTLGGAANALAQPAVNASLSQRIPDDRLGLALGIKQSAIPAATLLGGLAVPTLGAWVGWRLTFAVAAVAAFGGALNAGRIARRGGTPVLRARRRFRDLTELRPLALIAVAGMLGAAASTSLGAFFVDAAVDTGIAEGTAGLVFAAASALGFTSRVTLGWHADRHPHGSPYGRIAALLAAGGPGYVLLSLGVPLTYVAGGLLAYAAGWAWPGLYHYAAVSQNPTMPAAATGVIQSGMSLGAGLGPLALGWLAEASSYRATWLAAAALSTSAALVTLLGRARLRRARRAATISHLAEVDGLDLTGGRRVATGVEAAHHVTTHLDVTVFRVAPGVVHEVAPVRRSGVVIVLSGDGLRLWLAALDSVARAGEHLPLPANQPFTLGNDGAAPLVVARATAHGRVDAGDESR